MKYRILLGTALVVLIYFIGNILTPMFVEKPLPAPYETIIVDEEDDDNYIKKQAWIEMIHLSAPEDNWRQMDQTFRINAIPTKKGTNELPVYGKWRELGSNNQAGRTVYTWFDTITEEVYTAADGGQIWKGEIGIENWHSINDHFKIPAIRFLTKFNESNFTRLLVHSSEWNSIGIMHSDDNGQNWTLASGLDNIVGWGFIKRTVVQNGLENVVYCLSQEWDNSLWQAVSCIYRSLDYGSSFEKIHTFDHNVDYVDIWTSQLNESSVYVIAKDGFYYLDESDNLISIASLPNGQNGNTILTGYDSGFSLSFYAMIRFDSQSHFYASGIDGQNWTETGTHNQGPFMVNSFAASPYQKDILYFGGIEAFTSFNAGQDWTLVNSWGSYYGSPEDRLHADIPSFNSFMTDQGDEYLFINTDGGTYISYDQMDNVENLSLNNLRISQYYSSYTCRFDPTYTHAGSQDQGYQRSSEGMNKEAINYDQIISGDYASMVSGDGGASIWMVYPGFAMYGPDINNTNTLVYDYFVGSNYQWLPKLMEDPLDPEKAYMAGGHLTSGAHIIHVERAGGNINYSELSFDFSNGTNANISALVYSKLNTNYWYVLTSENDFFYSTDAGVTWMETIGFNGPGSHYFYGASIAPSNNTLGLIYIGGSGYSNPGVYRSTDNGESFVAVSEGLPNTMVFQVVLNANDSLLFAATEVGAFVCKTWEEQWYPLTDSIVPDQSFWAVDYVDTLKLARFSTYGRGIWDFELDPDVIADFEADNTFITSSEMINFTDLSSYSPISWDWHFEGGTPETSDEQNPSEISYVQPGAYDVRLIVSNDHSTDTILKVDYITVGITDITDDRVSNNFIVYPNPGLDHLNIQFYKIETIKSIQILSVSGQVLIEENNPVQITTISTENLKSGLYFVRINSVTGVNLYKWVKK